MNLKVPDSLLGLCNRWLKLESIYVVACLALFILQIQLIWIHIPWRDELQAYLLARDTKTLEGWWTNFRYEGHAPLWHAVVRLSSFVVTGPDSLKFALIICVSLTYIFIIFRSPFSFFVKILICSNYFIFFEYGIIARDYSLGVTLAFAAASFSAYWYSWVLIALLPQAGIQFEMIAGLLLLTQWIKGRRSVSGVLLVSIGMIISFLQIRPNPDFQTINGLIAQDSIFSSIVLTMRYAGTVLLPISSDFKILGWSEPQSSFEIIILLVSALLLPVLSVIAARSLPVFGWGTPLFCISTYAMSIFLYPMSTRHFGLIIVLIILGFWNFPDYFFRN